MLLFWHNLWNMLIKCIDKEILAEIGKKIKKMDKVGTNAVGKCVGKITRIKISMDITRCV